MLILVPLLECDGMAQGTEERCDIVDEEMSNGRALSSYNRAASKRTRRRKSIHPSSNAARERSRVQNLKQAFLELQKALPNVPSGTKLSKLDILLLATNYISHLMSKLSNGHLKEHLSRLKDKGALHPIKVCIIVNFHNFTDSIHRTFEISWHRLERSIKGIRSHHLKGVVP